MNPKCLLLLAAFAASATTPMTAQIVTQTVGYNVDGTRCESRLVFTPRKGGAPRPGLLMVPNWMGPTDASLEKAKQIAGDDYFVMMVDMYGVDVRPSNGQEAGAAAGVLRGDRELMRKRAATALAVFREHAGALGMDADRVAAIGFCFGGGTVLELGRSGANLDAIVSFHGDLKSPTLAADAGKTKAKVLVCHGADDPYVPQGDVQQFIEVMKGTEVDWQLEQYSGTVHSFTDPEAKSDGARFHERSAERAYANMRRLFAEIWGS